MKADLQHFAELTTNYSAKLPDFKLTSMHSKLSRFLFLANYQFLIISRKGLFSYSFHVCSKILEETPNIYCSKLMKYPCSNIF
jgi:hypothetical protein